MTKIALGTVQFGMKYGISNETGQVSRNEIKSILSFARSNAIDTIDTAIAYGNSESRLGESDLNGFKLVTKLPAFPEECADVGCWLEQEFQASLMRLNMSSIYGLLLHRPDQLLGRHGNSLAKALENLKARGLVEKIGISVYSPIELDILMDTCTIDLVQVPFNLIDRRIYSSGWLQKLYDRGVEVHTRSAFLQGLMLMPFDEIPEKFKHWWPLFDNWHCWLRDNNISAAKACIDFVQSYQQISKVVVGVTNLQQLEELIQMNKKPLDVNWPSIECLDEGLINPSTWVSP